MYDRKKYVRNKLKKLTENERKAAIAKMEMDSLVSMLRQEALIKWAEMKRKERAEAKLRNF